MAAARKYTVDFNGPEISTLLNMLVNAEGRLDPEFDPKELERTRKIIRRIEKLLAD